MPNLFPGDDARLARAIGQLSYANPFTDARIRLEREVLGEDHVPHDLWIKEPGQVDASPHLEPLLDIAEAVLSRAQARRRKVAPDESSWTIYGDLALYVLYYRLENDFWQVIIRPETSPVQMPFWRRFLADWQTLLGDTPMADSPGWRPEHLFALFFQIRRAFHMTYRVILGTTRLASQLRAEVWQSIFTHHLDRYRLGLYARMQEISTLILGESGTGKELVASAIGLSRYIPFHPGHGRFEEDFRQCFQPVHLAALPATLLESELFGHRKGAYTGAISDRAGYLETRHPAQTVFLDEIGELPAEIQVKLLRVLQNRSFMRLGDNKPLTFHGKIVSATHRDLAAEMAAGRFREDLYYRLCSDTIRTPTLAAQLAEKPDEHRHLVQVISLKLAPPELAEELANEAIAWIESRLAGYAWPGNMRELEQCVRGILVRGRYEPPQRAEMPGAARDRLAADVAAGRLDLDSLLGRYFAVIYARSGSYEAAAQALGADWRTVKTRLDRDFLRQLGQDGG